MKKSIFSIFVLLILSFGQVLGAYKHNIAICAIFKDNAPYLKEWIEYHRMVGVTHFYLFDNSSSDFPETVLQPYINHKIVTLVQWPNQNPETWGNQVFAWVTSTQKTAYFEGIKLAQGKAKWLALIDTDEYIVPMKNKSLKSFLKKHDSAGGISLKWECFGTSNVYDLAPGELLIEKLIMKCLPGDVINDYEKVIVKPKYFKKFTWIPHKAAYKKGKAGYLADRKEVRINHYLNRTLKFFYEHKIKNKIAMDNRPFTDEQINAYLNIGSSVEDHDMKRFVPALKKRMNSKNF